MQLMTIFAMLTAAVGVLFALQNHASVAVSLFAWQFEASLAIVLLLTLAVGGFIVGLVSTPSTIRRQWEIRQQQKRIESLELRIETLQKENASLHRSAAQGGSGLVIESPYKEMPKLVATESDKPSGERSQDAG